MAEDAPGSQNEDWDLLIRAARRAPIVHVDEPLVRVLWGRSSFYASEYSTKISSLRWMMARHPEIVGCPPGAARVYGQLACWSAAAGERRNAWRYAKQSVRANWKEPRAVIALGRADPGHHGGKGARDPSQAGSRHLTWVRYHVGTCWKVTIDVKRTPITLADGRELIYFDERDDAVRASVDRRQLPAQAPPAQLRWDPLTEEWIAVAAHRQARIFLPPSHECPLCPSTERFLTEVPADDYDVVVFENRFPSFAGETGRCEVVCFSPDHSASFKDLTAQRVRTVLDAFTDRTAELSRLPGVRAGLLLREPRRGDRRHPAPPARPDLRLPLCHADDAALPAGVRARGQEPLRRAWWRRSGWANGWWPATSSGRRSSPMRPAGPTRSTSRRTGRSPTSPS